MYAYAHIVILSTASCLSKHLLFVVYILNLPTQLKKICLQTAAIVAVFTMDNWTNMQTGQQDCRARMNGAVPHLSSLSLLAMISP